MAALSCFMGIMKVTTIPHCRGDYGDFVVTFGRNGDFLVTRHLTSTHQKSRKA